ncbi:hypothetical protein SAMN04487948_105336 [Halogranum amylolyticum]|uniref:DUF7129 domain-containing protein n=1 Tax=Halogranum amylolyticum TaxID=660520 RepID=A0A1H8SUM4_9EURY|nr:rubrerythrin-like domain-containing protein [Halogranum amylolyticum]SEO82287.1 hypothetical protein SAMN04487948_105336 [Halogranum amylolyticum]
MVLHNTALDPYTPERRYYECRSCGHRTTSPTHVATCPECDGEVHNIGVARE